MIKNENAEVKVSLEPCALEYVGTPISGQCLKAFIRERVPGVAEIELLSDAAQRRRASSASPLFSPGDTG